MNFSGVARHSSSTGMRDSTWRSPGRS